MSRRSSPPPPPRSPLDDDDLLREILLRLPPLPSSLPRAACVCKRWRRLVSDPRFRRRFRARHRDPPLHGFFVHGDRNACFWARPGAAGPHLRLARHPHGEDAPWMGYPQLLPRAKKFMVLDPIAGEQHPVPFPSVEEKFGVLLAMAVPAADHDRPRSSSYRLIALLADRATRTRVSAYVYSSESGSWGDSVVSTLILPSKAIHLGRPGIVSGNVIHWFLHGYKILTFDLERQVLAFIKLPPEVVKNTDSNYEFRCQIIPALGDGVGHGDGQLSLAVLAEPNMQFWKRKKTGGDGSGATYTWVLSTTVRLNFPPLESGVSDLEYQVLGFDDESNAIFLRVHGALFMVSLKSMQTRKVLDQWPPVDIFPYSSF